MENSREKLIRVGIEELNESGLQNLSIRHVAQRCGLSCAAPYKHFKDKQDFLMAIAEVMNRQWFTRQALAVESLVEDSAVRLRAVCREYLRFLREKPYFCELITQKDSATGKWYLSHLFDSSSLTKKLIAEYVKEHGLTEEETYCRVYAVRAVLYGAAMLNQYDETRMSDEVFETLSQAIEMGI